MVDCNELLEFGIDFSLNEVDDPTPPTEVIASTSQSGSTSGNPQCASSNQNEITTLEPTPIGPLGVENIVPAVPAPTSIHNFFSTTTTSAKPQYYSKQITSSSSCKGQEVLTFDQNEFALIHPMTGATIAPPSTNNTTNGSVNFSCFPLPPMKRRRRKYQTDLWHERYQNLLRFREQHGHLSVPHSYPQNQKLAQWAKRQRHQYKLKCMGHHTTLSDERFDLLSTIGFVWDSHTATWQDHFHALEDFYLMTGHCNVTAKHSDQSLYIWCKHQRRQYQQLQAGESTSLTEERFNRLEKLGFDWDPRKLKTSNKVDKNIAWTKNPFKKES